jgi:glycosyltransferase involved in cell wall biosynthesis
VSVRLVVDSDDWEQAWNERLPYSKTQQRLFTWQEKWGLRYADAVTAASRTLERLVAGQRRDGQARVFYVPNGYVSQGDADRGQTPELAPEAVREQWQLGQAPTVLLYTRFVEFRLERIVNLVQRVADQLPEARWLIVGRGLQGEERRLASQLTQAGLAEGYVRFTGWVPVEQLPAYFRAVDVASFPYDDTLINRTKCSVKLIDLLAAGLPVVADAVGQNCEYIRHDLSGILVPAGDDAAFSEALVDLLQAPEKRRSLGQAAAQHIRDDFNWSHLSRVVESAYSD